MYDFHPYFTSDGSVGLYSPIYNDIYHSATGALTEANEKFIDPIQCRKYLNKYQVKVLDICYGIGYNSKSFLQKMYLLTRPYTASLYTNNIKDKLSVYTNEIHADNISSRISVTAIDNDKNLAFLSPFIKTGEQNIKNEKFDFEYKILEKYLKNDKNIPKPKIEKIINFLLFEKIALNYPEIFENKDIETILGNKEYSRYFDDEIKAVFWHYKYTTGNFNPFEYNQSFLHNIYYNHVSKCYKKRLKRYKLQDIDFNFKTGDAREIIKNDRNTYDLIFLDAFTPSKCPILWSYEFFKLLYEHLEYDGLLLTYSISASVRNAMAAAGFFVGNNFNPAKNKVIGTIATKNKYLIKYPLSKFDLGLLKTTAGIFYHDENLNGQNEAIIERRNLEVQNSNLMTSSQYNKKYKTL